MDCHNLTWKPARNTLERRRWGQGSLERIWARFHRTKSPEGLGIHPAWADPAGMEVYLGPDSGLYLGMGRLHSRADIHHAEAEAHHRIYGRLAQVVVNQSASSLLDSGLGGLVHRRIQHPWKGNLRPVFGQLWKHWTLRMSEIPHKTDLLISQVL